MKNPVIILLIVILAAVLGLGVYLFLTNRKKAEETAPEMHVSENPEIEVI